MTCADCGKTHHRLTRALCPRCRHHHEHRGTLTDWPRLTVPINVLIEDAAWLIEAGETNRHTVAQRVGMKVESMEQALFRAKRNGNAQSAAIIAALTPRRKP